MSPPSEVAALIEDGHEHSTAHRANGYPDSSLPLSDLLDVLEYRNDEFVSVCHLPPGGAFSAAVMSPGAAPAYVDRLGQSPDIWFGANPVAESVGAGKRGTADQVTRLAALYADLDVKPGGCADLATAELIVEGVSAVLGQRPSVVVFSGHGLQPIWPIDEGDICAEFTTADATSLLNRFGRLVAAEAETYSATVDPVFELARVLRVPGTVNHKGIPVPTSARADVGGPLGVGEIGERLDEVGIYTQADDATDREVLSDPGAWQFAERTCAYVAKMVAGLAADGPRLGGGRNPWACYQAVRLCCAWRQGCITEADFRRAVVTLEGCLATLLATTEPRRALRKLEIRAAFNLGRKRAAEKTDDEARAELGWHRHTDGTTAEDFWGTGGAESAAEAPPDDGESRRPATIDGATFILDQPDTIPALWGRDNSVLWARGEALMIAGGMGLGKTTIAGQVVDGLLFGGDVLGLPIIPLGDDAIVLYLAMDRPRQIARSMRRQFGEQHRDVLSRRLKVRPGPPPADIARNPELLAVMAQAEGAHVVIIDSVKDAALGLSDDQVGAAYNRARQTLLASGRELCELHHTVKRSPTGAAPSSAADIYGSTWLTAGCGSVVLLTGEPGDPIVGFRHVKQPAAEVGPFRLLHDQTAGRLTVDHVADLVALVKAAGPDGLTAKAAAAALFDKTTPTRADVQKARRKLDDLVDAKRLSRMEGGTGRGHETAWFEA